MPGEIITLMIQYHPDPYEGGPQGNDKRGCFGKSAALVLLIVLVFILIS